MPKFRSLIQIKLKICSARSEVTNRLTHSMADLSWPLKYASVLERKKTTNLHLCLRHSIDRFLYKSGYSSLFVPQAASRAHLSGKREREPWMSSENSFVKSLSSFFPSSFLIGNRVLRMEEGAIIASLPNAPIRAQTDAIFSPVKFSTWLTSERILFPPPPYLLSRCCCVLAAPEKAANQFSVAGSFPSVNKSVSCLSLLRLGHGRRLIIKPAGLIRLHEKGQRSKAVGTSKNELSLS